MSRDSYSDKNLLRTLVFTTGILIFSALFFTLAINLVAFKKHSITTNLAVLTDLDAFNTNCSSCPANMPKNCGFQYIPVLGGVDLVEFFNLDEVTFDKL
jgi:hypothetical protein